MDIPDSMESVTFTRKQLIAHNARIEAEVLARQPAGKAAALHEKAMNRIRELEAVLFEISQSVANPVGDAWAFYEDVRKFAGDAIHIPFKPMARPAAADAAALPVAWRVTGNYTDQPFKDESSADAYLSGLLTTDPDGGYMKSPLYPLINRPAAVMAGGLSDDVAAIVAEVQQARDNWPPFNSAHEGYAVLAEEVDELWDHIKTNQKRRDLPAMRKEAMQVAAMALRFMGECCDETTGRK